MVGNPKAFSRKNTRSIRHLYLMVPFNVIVFTSSYLNFSIDLTQSFGFQKKKRHWEGNTKHFWTFRFCILRINSEKLKFLKWETFQGPVKASWIYSADMLLNIETCWFSWMDSIPIWQMSIADSLYTWHTACDNEVGKSEARHGQEKLRLKYTQWGSWSENIPHLSWLLVKNSWKVSP